MENQIDNSQRKDYRAPKPEHECPPGKTPVSVEDGEIHVGQDAIQNRRDVSMDDIQSQLQAMQEAMKAAGRDRTEDTRPAHEQPTEPMPVKMFTGQRIFNVGTIGALIAAFMFANDPQPAENANQIVELKKQEQIIKPAADNASGISRLDAIDKRVDTHEERLNFLMTELSNTNVILGKLSRGVKSRLKSLEYSVSDLWSEVEAIELNRKTLLQLGRELADGPKNFVMWIDGSGKRQAGDLLIPQDSNQIFLK